MRQRYRYQNSIMQNIIDTEVSKKLSENIIGPSMELTSSYCTKMKWKATILYWRKINEVTQKDAYSLPFINCILDKLRKARSISSLDLTGGYWQIEQLLLCVKRNELNQGSLNYSPRATPCPWTDFVRLAES